MITVTLAENAPQQTLDKAEVDQTAAIIDPGGVADKATPNTAEAADHIVCSESERLRILHMDSREQGFSPNPRVLNESDVTSLVHQCLTLLVHCLSAHYNPSILQNT